ncbi:putative G-protein coupled receptor 19 [Saccoglossus kowalevskii]|uniref:Probable G-protein coupled receptor 19-like n=1 Tax=Saccoglossus kowalevskii TaxID=10224 RepID=A0ABM0H065_SACKO|nr:PREDICTED: probable G-protein coupled receptor 19-like [Saccoglossus kowalevskii]
MATMNSTDVHDWQDPYRTSTNVILEMLTLCIMWIGCVFGNTLVCVVVYRSRRMQSTTNYFVVSLAWADLLVAFFCMPFIASRVVTEEWIFGDFMCKIVRFLQILAPGSTVYVLLAIAFDRFYTIIYPLSFKVTRGKAKQMIAGSWLFAAIIASPSFYLYGAVTSDYPPGTILCNTYIPRSVGAIIYSVFIFLIIFLVPVVIILVVYIRIFKYIWTVGVGGRTFQRTMNTVPRTKVKTIKMLSIVNIFYFLSWAPFIFVQLWFACSHSTYINPTVYVAVTWVSFASSVSNPIIYSCYNANFRRGCKEVFCMSNMRCYRSNTYAITTASRFGKKNHIGVVDMSNGNGHYRASTPTKTFDRDSKGDKKMAWPLAARPGPDTYL